VIQKNWQELIKPNKLEIAGGRQKRVAPSSPSRSSAASADARQRAAPRAPVLAAGRGGHGGADRRRAARILVDSRRARGS
jgi:hypothetical protein